MRCVPTALCAVPSRQVASDSLRSQVPRGIRPSHVVAVREKVGAGRKDAVSGHIFAFVEEVGRSVAGMLLRMEEALGREAIDGSVVILVLVCVLWMLRC